MQQPSTSTEEHLLPYGPFLYTIPSEKIMRATGEVVEH
jgi:hypothetical protein